MEPKSQTKYYIGDDNGEVAIFQGVPTSIFGAKLSHAVTDTNMKTSDLPPSWREQLDQGISFDTYGEAKSHTRLIKKQLNDAKRKQEARQQEKAEAEQKAKDEAAAKQKQRDEAAKRPPIRPRRPTSRAVTSHDRNTLETAWHAAVQHAAVHGGVLPDV